MSAENTTNPADFPGDVYVDVDYVRVYQPKGADNTPTCNPVDYPTKPIIDAQPDLYLWPLEFAFETGPPPPPNG